MFVLSSPHPLFVVVVAVVVVVVAVGSGGGGGGGGGGCGGSCCGRGVVLGFLLQLFKMLFQRRQSGAF